MLDSEYAGAIFWTAALIVAFTIGYSIRPDVDEWLERRAERRKLREEGKEIENSQRGDSGLNNPKTLEDWTKPKILGSNAHADFLD